MRDRTFGAECHNAGNRLAGEGGGGLWERKGRACTPYVILNLCTCNCGRKCRPILCIFPYLGHKIVLDCGQRTILRGAAFGMAYTNLNIRRIEIQR